MIKVAAHGSRNVHISYVAAQGISRECGNWDEDFSDTADNQPHPNHGCAVRSNIAAMIANPEDLEMSRGTSANPSADNVAKVRTLDTSGVN
jgi:pilus biogenesis lipoprotein CpaD